MPLRCGRAVFVSGIHSARTSLCLYCSRAMTPVFPRYSLRGVDIHVAAVKVSEYLNCTVALVTETFRAPLCHPARTGDLLSVTVLRQNRLLHIRSRQIVFKHFIYYQRDIVIYISAIDEFVVICCGRSDIKIIALSAIKLRVYPV